jgi:predicted acylesterase/phospholipase RssA
VQQEALCTYKDPLLPLDTRLRRAMKRLAECQGGLAGSPDPETLGLAGAIHKRLWEVDGRRDNLERAFRYYHRGYDAMIAARERLPADAYDGGAYAGVNAAFVADLLRDEEQLGLTGGAEGSLYATEAKRIRNELVDRLPAMKKNDWWHHASLAEAYLGLAPEAPEHYAAAAAALRRAMAPGGDDWKRESTATQLSALVDLQSRLHGAEIGAKGWEVVAELVPENPEALKRPVHGKFGLGLSGGGFRASLYHIGVLARLAELDLLRQVEVLSCVSGGSIVGAHYYLELRRLLHTETDAGIDRDDYIGIVRKLEKDFLEGVQTNIRVRVAASLTTNWWMLLRPRRYSRSQRVGDLYEEKIFSRIEDGETGQPRRLNDLFVSPLVEEDDGTKRQDDGFSPKLHNWRRRAKVPILILNATTLNTGRNWQFTASSMGESVSYGTGIDSTERFETVYYGEAPEGHREVRLGQAVAASAGVPGLFDPIVLEKLYGDRVVRLVDGGVHDNQGARALLDNDCNVLLVSDASGQMGSDPDPSNSSLGVILRTNSVLQARLRIAQRQEVEARHRSRLVREEMFVHLKQDLQSPAIPPLQDATGGAAPGPSASPPTTTTYGVDCQVQAALAAIRTDLDSFTDREAYALMASGYRATERSLGRVPAFAGLPDHRAPWRFLALEPEMRSDGAGYPALLQQLQVGEKLAFKVWSLDPTLRVLRWVLLALAVGLALWGAYLHPSSNLPIKINWWGLIVTISVMALAAYSKPAGQAAGFLLKWFRFRATLKRMAAGLGMGTVGFLLARLHLGIFDKLFLKLGRFEKPEEAATPLPAEHGPA